VSGLMTWHRVRTSRGIEMTWDVPAFNRGNIGDLVALLCYPKNGTRTGMSILEICPSNSNHIICFVVESLEISLVACKVGVFQGFPFVEFDALV